MAVTLQQLRLDLLLQLVLAVLLGGLIGLERELWGKPAGLRTNILICLGATLFTTLSVHMAAGRGDPGRVAAQVLTGVGFIGAGTILHTRGNVTGLTSAATIWVVAAIGMALGVGAYVEAIGSTVLVLVVLVGLVKVEAFVGRWSSRSHIVVHATPGSTTFEDVETLIRRGGLDIVRCESRQENVDLVMEFDLRGPHRLHDQALVALQHAPGVRSVSTGE